MGAEFSIFASMMLRIIATTLLLLWVGIRALLAQPTFPVNGVWDEKERCYAFTNATIHTSWNTVLDKATLVIRKGRVVSVGTGVGIPADAVITDLKGKHIYPALIDLYSGYGLPESKRPQEQRGFGGTPAPMLNENQSAVGWNAALKPGYAAVEEFSRLEGEAKEWRMAGFGAVLSHKLDGLSRGTGVLVLTGNEPAQLMVLKERAAHVLSFKKGSSPQDYPGSLMGAIALLRQTYYDADWYKKTGRSSEVNLDLESWNSIQNLPQIFEVRDWQELLRAQKIAGEFGLKFIYKGNGDEYQRADAIKATGAGLIIPLVFPDPFDTDDPYETGRVQYSELKHWELAPSNPAILAKAGIPFALTTYGLKDKSKWLEAARKAIQNGLDESIAMKALTATPAEMMGIQQELGSLQTGKRANFIITSGPMFDEKTIFHETWVNGIGSHWKALDDMAINPGRWMLQLGDSSYTVYIKAQMEKGYEFSLTRKNDSTRIKMRHQLKQEQLVLSFNYNTSGSVRLNGTFANGRWAGNALLPDGTWKNWSMDYVDKVESDTKKVKKDSLNVSASDFKIASIPVPFNAFGFADGLPKAGIFIVKNATVWTNTKDGILKETDVLVENGKIVRVGKRLPVPGGAIEVDGSGLHLTSGIVDEHSHIAITRGVNECSQAITAEVRVGDVIDCQDIDIYRHLAGGVTMVQQLHGSCNPAGGQSSLIKLRWGALPEAMKVEGADGFIKFALGENVKRSGSRQNNRFPDTRMGVEQVYEDAFTRAKEYAKLQSTSQNYRKDLELEALAEILNKKRFITCHSYVQSEINMLMKLADRHHFKVNTFTHILEGYKVADKMAAHGAGGSSFSDWWAYKYEVWDAIPYNGALLNSQGVITAFNSDDAEMARRLNQEAAKAVLYGGVSEEEAWKFVTLNPAKLLHVDHRVGSIAPGKDADLVLWNEHPLSVYARAEKTWVDGILYFDRKKDEVLQVNMDQEKARILEAMAKAKKSGSPTTPVRSRPQRFYGCEDADDELRD